MAKGRQVVEESGLNYKEWEELIDLWIFNAEHREMLKAHLLDGVGFEALAERYNYSTTWVKKKIYEAESRLFTKIK